MLKADDDIGMEVEKDISIKAGNLVVIDCAAGMSLTCGSNFITITPAGIDIQGTLVNINSGGSANAGFGVRPPDLKPAQYAANAKPGEKSNVAATPARTKATKYGPTAVGLKRGSQSGTPFCKRCAEAAAAAPASTDGAPASRRGGPPS